jgi:hypothetical protein
VTSTTTHKPETPDQVRTLAKAWHAQQVARLSQCLGPSWPLHRDWLLAYLAEELRQKLIARGWRPKR